MIRISIDAMGGDHGPETIIPGLAKVAERRPDAHFVIFGQEERVRPVLDSQPLVAARSEFHHCDVSVGMDDKPSQALRRGRWKSSMWRAIEAVKNGESDVCVSAGNTGALMAMSKFCLRTMADIERPAIAAIWPTMRGESVVLDVGATIGADAQQLIDFSILGAAMARAVLGLERPSIGLLNVGVEEVKGQEEVKEAGRLLREAELKSMDYRGFVEGDDIGRGSVDVVVTEGFAGNIALKTAEGTAKQIAEYLRAAMGRTFMTKLGYVLARDAFNHLREKMDVRRANGGVFLGLNGIVVKSHGGADPEGFAAAVELGYDMARSRLMGNDAAIGLVFPAMFALGVLLINLNARNLHLDADTVLLGEIGFVWLHTVELAGYGVPVAMLTLGAVALVNAAFVGLLWKELKLSSFDPALAAALGFRPGLLGLALLALVSVTAVAAFDAVGVVLFLAFLIVPAVTGQLLCRGLAAMLGVAMLSGLASVGLGYGLALRWDVSIGGMMALCTGAGLGLALLASPRSGLVAVLLRRRALALEARVRVLLIHLAAHQGTPVEAEENTLEALEEHLRWPPDMAQAVVLAALDQGLIRRHAQRFELSETGQARATAWLRAEDRRRAMPPERVPAGTPGSDA